MSGKGKNEGKERTKWESSYKEIMKEKGNGNNVIVRRINDDTVKEMGKR